MKKLFLILASAAVLSAQSYPTSIYTPLVARDNLQTTLSTAMAAGDTTAFVASTTGWAANMPAYICDTSTATRCTGTFEVMLVTAVPGANALTVTRGYGGTSAVAHASGKAVLNAPVAAFPNSLGTEVRAIETALGANLSNIPVAPGTNAGRYAFTAYGCNASAICTPGGSSGASLVNGNNPLTFQPVPLGMNGTDNLHRLWVSGGTGASEACLISGGSGTSGQTSGSIVISCSNSHSGAFTIISNSGGIKEASVACAATGGRVQIPGGTFNVRGLFALDLSDGCSVRGSGINATVINFQDQTGRGVQWIGSVGNGGVADLGDFQIAYANNGASQEGLYIQDSSVGNLTNVLFGGSNPYDGLTMVSVAKLGVSGIFGGVRHNGINLSSNPASSITTSSYPQVSRVHLVLLPGVGTGLNLGPTLAGPQFADVFFEQGADCVDAIASNGNPINEIDFQGTCDAYTTNGWLTSLSGGSTSARVTIHDSKFVGGIYGMLHAGGAANAITTLTITGNTIGYSSVDGIRLQGVTGAQITGNTVYNSTASAGVGQAIELNTTADSQIHITGNTLGGGIVGGGTSNYDVFLGAQNHTDIFIDSNHLLAPATAAIGDGHTGSGLVEWTNNKGVDDVIGTAASAATLAFPINPKFTVTGTTNVTAVSGLFQGRAGFFTPTAATITFTAGATIGNSIVAQQNVPVDYYFDGTKVWLNGPAPPVYLAAGTVQLLPHSVFGTCTLGTNCAVTFAGGAAFTSSSSYSCTATDQTAAAAVKVVNTSASVATFTGTGTDVIAYVCLGN